MHWLYLTLAVAFFFGAYKTSGWVMLALLLASLLAGLAWMLGMLSARISRGSKP